MRAAILAYSASRVVGQFEIRICCAYRSNGEPTQRKWQITHRGKTLARFELSLDAWIARWEATTNSRDPLWRGSFSPNKRARNLIVRNPRMKRLHRKLDSALNMVIVQSAQRRKFITELRVIKNSDSVRYPEMIVDGLRSGASLFYRAL